MKRAAAISIVGLYGVCVLAVIVVFIAMAPFAATAFAAALVVLGIAFGWALSQLTN